MKTDETIITNGQLPNRWKCPNCGTVQEFGLRANDILLENFKYIEHCERCGNLHFWKLELTDDYKKKVMELLKREVL